jgi:hypothetical protein
LIGEKKYYIISVPPNQKPKKTSWHPIGFAAIARTSIAIPSPPPRGRNPAQKIPLYTLQ